MNQDELVQELNLQNLPKEEQENTIEHFITRVGELLAEDLTQAQLEEFQGIIDQNEEVIQNFLQSNVPDYKNTALFKEIEKDNEGHSVEKMYAYTVWLSLNKPDYQEKVDQVKQEFRRPR